jgi:hypothetical protein
MRKPKLDPKIIRRGDRVRVVIPEIFVRCGYPLCKADLKEDIYKHYGRLVEDIIYSVGKGDKLISRDEDGIFPSPSRAIDSCNNKIIDILASIRLVAKNFGGNERKVFTKRYDEIKDRIFQVRGIRFVTTGEYVRGYSGYSYEGDWDCDPPYLSDPKVHKILSLDLCRKEIDEDFITQYLKSNSPMFREYQLVEIEAKNVKKLTDDREFIQDEKGNWIKNKLYLVATEDVNSKMSVHRIEDVGDREG